jgi:hypothetical protein
MESGLGPVWTVFPRTENGPRRARLASVRVGREWNVDMITPGPAVQDLERGRAGSYHLDGSQSSS